MVLGNVEVFDIAESLMTDYDNRFLFAESRVNVSLHTEDYEPDYTQEYRSDCTNEVVGGNYASRLLRGREVLYDTATKRFQFTASRVVWPDSSIHARYAVISFAGVSGGEYPELLCWVDFGQTVWSTHSQFILSWESGVVFELEGTPDG